MKRTAMFAFVSIILASVGCRTSAEPPREEQRQASLEASSVAHASATLGASETRPSCSQVGGTCRKSACRVNETLEHFQCGTDAACCVPAP